MEIYHDLGFLIFGSRLRRMSEYYIAEINKVYKAQNIEFEASWFPIFYFLHKREEVNLREIADQLQVSHSAISQLIKNLREKGLVATRPYEHDRRQIIVQLTPQGKVLMKQTQPIWESISKSMDIIKKSVPETEHLLSAFTALEIYFDEISLSSVILKNLK